MEPPEGTGTALPDTDSSTTFVPSHLRLMNSTVTGPLCSSSSAADRRTSTGIISAATKSPDVVVSSGAASANAGRNRSPAKRTTLMTHVSSFVSSDLFFQTMAAP